MPWKRCCTRRGRKFCNSYPRSSKNGGETDGRGGRDFPARPFPAQEEPMYVDEPQRQYYARPRDQRYEDLPTLRAAVEARRNLSRVADVTLDDLVVNAGKYAKPGTA